MCRVMQQSNDCWNNTSKEWNPDRWLAEGIDAKYKHWLVVSKSIIHRKQTQIITNQTQFGLGFNRCPGEQLALLQIFKISATLVRDYDINQVDPGNEWKYKAYFTVVPHSWPVYITRVPGK